MDLNRLLEYAKTFEGVPYQWGGKGYPNDFGLDCSGYVSIILRKAGIVLPQKEMNSHMLYTWARENPKGIGLGCLAFFGKNDRANHVGWMIDDNCMLSAAGGGPDVTSVDIAKTRDACVQIQRISFYRSPALLGSFRIPYPFQN